MRRFLPPAVAAILFAALSGCDKSEPYLAVARDQVRAQEELVDLLSTVKDKASMDAARDALRRSNDHLEELARQARKLPQPSAGLQQRLSEELGGKVQTSLTRLREEVARIKTLPGGNAFVKDLDQGQ